MLNHERWELGFPIAFPLRAFARNCAQLFSNCAQVKSTCVGTPSGNSCFVNIVIKAEIKVSSSFLAKMEKCSQWISRSNNQDYCIQPKSS